MNFNKHLLYYYSKCVYFFGTPCINNNKMLTFKFKRSYWYVIESLKLAKMITEERRSNKNNFESNRIIADSNTYLRSVVAVDTKMYIPE